MPDEIRAPGELSRAGVPCADGVPCAADERIATELDILRALCDVRHPAEKRLAILRALAGYRFTEPEYQVLFEAIAAISRVPVFSTGDLAVQLNNRGFPEVDLEQYVTNETLDNEDAEDALEQALRLASASNRK